MLVERWAHLQSFVDKHTIKEGCPALTKADLIFSCGSRGWVRSTDRSHGRDRHQTKRTTCQLILV